MRKNLSRTRWRCCFDSPTDCGTIRKSLATCRRSATMPTVPAQGQDARDTSKPTDFGQQIYAPLDPPSQFRFPNSIGVAPPTKSGQLPKGATPTHRNSSQQKNAFFAFWNRSFKQEFVLSAIQAPPPNFLMRRGMPGEHPLIFGRETVIRLVKDPIIRTIGKAPDAKLSRVETHPISSFATKTHVRHQRAVWRPPGARAVALLPEEHLLVGAGRADGVICGIVVKRDPVAIRRPRWVLSLRQFPPFPFPQVEDPYAFPDAINNLFIVGRPALRREGTACVNLLSGI